MCIELIVWVSKKSQAKKEAVSQKQEESWKGSPREHFSRQPTLLQVSLHSFSTSMSHFKKSPTSCIHLNIYQTQKHEDKSLPEQKTTTKKQMNETILLSWQKSQNVSTHREAAQSLSQSIFPNREELAQTHSLRMGATSRVQWRTMHVCRSVSSGDTERSSHQAAAHMGQGEGGKEREEREG